MDAEWGGGMSDRKDFLAALDAAEVRCGPELAEDIREARAAFAALLDTSRRVNEYLGGWGQHLYRNAVYLTPAQQLRAQADAMERKEREINAFREALITLGDTK